MSIVVRSPDKRWIGPFADASIAYAYTARHGGQVMPGCPKDTVLLDPQGGGNDSPSKVVEAQVVKSESANLTGPLSEADRAEKVRLEGVIDRNLKTTEETISAIVDLHEKRLYRDEGTWAQYCAKHWGKSRQHGYRLKDFFETAGNVACVATLENEYQARTLKAGLKDANDQKFAALLAKEIAVQANRPKPNATDYRAAAETVKSMKQTGFATVQDIQVQPGKPLPPVLAQGVTEAVEIYRRQQQHIVDNSRYARMEGGEYRGTAIQAVPQAIDWLSALLSGCTMNVKIVVYVEKKHEQNEDAALCGEAGQ